MSKGPLFFAKILLFGEYGIIKDSMGLSVPYSYYRGAFQLPEVSDERTHSSNESLRKFRDYLGELIAKGELPTPLDLDRFKADIEEGWFFDSSIPQGFGVGSSGALVAAVYDRYGIDKIHPAQDLSRENLILLKRQFALMENYFHGKSSGIDPTICYLNLPLLIKSQDDLDTVAIPSYEEGQGAVFLINSGEPGETQPLVNYFMERLKEDGFRKLMKDQFNKYNDACIQAFLKGDTKPLFSNLKKLSQLLLDNFSPMIPGQFHEMWKKGIETNDYYLKLCGSGGGGYILGFTRDFNHALKQLKDFKPEIIYRF